MGRIVNHHGIKKGGLEQLAQPLKQVQVDDQSTHPSIHQSFVASGRCIEPDAPAFFGKPLEPGCDTHKRPLSAHSPSGEENGPFSQKPPARVQVVPFLGIQVDQGFSRSGGVVGGKVYV